MTAPTPNAALAYAVLDHIDAHPEEWDQGVYIGKTDCGTVACFAGRAILLSLPESAVHFSPSSRRLPNGVVRMESGAVVGADGIEVSCRVMAEELLGASSWMSEGQDDEEDLFDECNTREDLGRLVAEIFGPRPEHCGYGLDHPAHGWTRLANDEHLDDQPAACPGGEPS